MRPPPKSSLLLAIAIPLHLAFLLSLKGGFLNFLFHDPLHSAGQGADFFAMYQAGYNLLRGESIYEDFPTTFRHGHWAVEYFYPFRYLPFSACTLGLIVNLMPPWTAYWAWVGFNEALLLLNLYLTRNLCASKAQFYGMCALWLSFSPFYVELSMGQFSFLMATGIFLMGYGFVKGKRSLTAWAWMGTALLKSNTLLFIPLFLRQRMQKVVLLCLLLIFMTSVPYFLFFPQDLKGFMGNLRSEPQWLARVIDRGGHVGFSALLMDLILQAYSLPLATATLQDVPWLYSFLLYLFPLISLLATFWARKMNPLENMGLWMCTYFLFYKHVWEHQLVMLLPILVLLFLKGPEGRGARALCLTAYVLLALPSPFFFIDVALPRGEDPILFWSFSERLLYRLPKVLPILALYGFLLVGHLRGRGPLTGWRKG